MRDQPSDSQRQARRGRPLLQVGGGVLGAAAALLVLVVPVVAMLLLTPRGTPTRLPDALAIGLLTLAGLLIGLLLRSASTRLPLAITVSALLTLIALWYQSGTWWSAGWVPTPPLLPNVAPTLTLTAGAFLAAGGLAAVRTARRDGRAAGRGGARRRQAAATPVVHGLLVAGALIVVVEGDVWGRGVIQETFQGPWGLGRFQWLALLFVALLIAGGLVGWLTGSARAGSPGPAVAAGILVVTVAVVWVSLGELGGPPRNTLYGLGLGLLLTATASALLGRSDQPHGQHTTRR